ncbi:MAG: hypothetical protein IT379_30265 [Deltaproteobacteria bacterium]|nr:hypothetical protein [Deltaproteobacteria bacterium]
MRTTTNKPRCPKCRSTDLTVGGSALFKHGEVTDSGFDLTNATIDVEEAVIECRRCGEELADEEVTR